MTTLIQPLYGGRPCGEPTKNKPCNQEACPGMDKWHNPSHLTTPSLVDCQLGGWKTIGTCPTTCGSGRQKYSREVITRASHGGKSCGPRTRHWPCDQPACPGEITHNPSLTHSLQVVIHLPKVASSSGTPLTP